MSSSPCGLVVDVEREPHAIRLRLAGELDLASAPGLEHQLDDLLGDDIRRVTIDLRDLEFLDSAGLRALLVAHRRLMESGRELLLGPGPKAVQRLFELTGSDRIFRFTG